MTRASRRGISGVLAGLLLFAQMAVAAYACPGMSPGAAARASEPLPASGTADASRSRPAGEKTGPMADMSCDCEQPDRDAANLCAEHCRYGNQNAESPKAPSIPPLLLTGHVTLPVPDARNLFSPSPGLPRFIPAASPPHAILHCCFRI